MAPGDWERRPDTRCVSPAGEPTDGMCFKIGLGGLRIGKLLYALSKRPFGSTINPGNNRSFDNHRAAIARYERRVWAPRFC
jgi:hypothetical protein